ncbi:MAG: hypothetical protein V1685_03790, partial [Parcubacteria group bacterium]
MTASPAKIQDVKVDFTNRSTLDEWKGYVNRIVLFREIPDAYKLVQVLPKALSQLHLESQLPDLLDEYDQILARARAIALSLLPSDQVEQFFADDIAVAFSDEDIILPDEVDAKMVRLVLLEDRDELKQKCRNRLLNNEKTITTNSFDISGQRLPGTVKNVLRFYNITTGTTKRVNSLLQTEFFSKLNTIVPDPDERMAIHRLIDVYEHLKLSSLTPEGLEESVSFVEGGLKRILRGGRLEHLRADDVAKLIDLYMNKPETEEKIEPRVTMGGRDSAY